MTPHPQTPCGDRMPDAHTPATHSTAHTPAAADGPLPRAPSRSTPQTLSSSELMRGQHTVAIAHNGAIYRLQTTRQGKLILTK